MLAVPFSARRCGLAVVLLGYNVSIACLGRLIALMDDAETGVFRKKNDACFLDLSDKPSATGQNLLPARGTSRARSCPGAVKRIRPKL